MKRREHGWISTATGEQMRLVHLGYAGPVLIYVPSSAGDHLEFERYRMHETCARWLDAGRLQVFSIDGFGPRTLFNDAIAPRERIDRYVRFERYVAGELLDRIAASAKDGLPSIVGASYGAFVAANLLFKYPSRVAVACGLGGVYGMWHRLDGFHDDDVYFHTPLEYLPRLDDPQILESIRKTGGLELYGAQDDEWLDSTRRMHRVLQTKRLPHTAEIWDSPANHHESWWRRQLERFLTGRLG